MRTLFAAGLMVLAALTPVAAQNAGQVVLPDPAQIDATADRDFWCGVAFLTLASMHGRRGEEEARAKASSDGTVILQWITLRMQALDMSKAQYDGMISLYFERQSDPFRDAADGYSRETCIAAADSARAEYNAALLGGPAPNAPVQPALP